VAKRKRHGSKRKPAVFSPPLRAHPGWIPSAVGFVVSVYLFTLDLLGTRAYCLARFDCDTVRSSVFASILGIPVAAIGVAFFGAALAICLLRAPQRHAWLAALAGIGAGGSTVFILLQAAVLRAACPYCLVADAAALIFAYLVVRTERGSRQIRIGLIAALTAAVIAGVYTLSSPPPQASPYASGLARHLAQSGAVMYGAYWCPHCQEQKAMFGSAARLLPYVECDPGGADSQASRCQARGIRVYPTWEFHGQLVEGVLSLDELAKRSGYPPPGQSQ
jgi:uncharacterized membrane protein